MKRSIVTSETRSSDSQIRIRAREALLAALDRQTTAANSLLEVASETRALSELGFPSPTVTKDYLLFAGLLECTSRLVSWTIAVRNCEVDANR